MHDLHELADRLRDAARAYYDTDTLLMSDEEYDDGIEQLRIAVAEDPALDGTFDDLLTSVAGGQSAGGDVTHSTMMGSLAKVISQDDVAAFVERIEAPVVVEPKLDGLALRAVYTNGQLTQVAKRGDGLTGEDITAKARNLNFLPDTLVGVPASMEVRGEVFIRTDDFATANEVRVSAGGATFVNERNAASGILNRGDGAYAGVMTFAVYDVLLPEPQDTYSDALEVARQAGFTVISALIPELDTHEATDVETVMKRVDRIGELRQNLGFPIDGAVVKANRFADRERLGVGSKDPHWAVAYKYKPDTATTTVAGITTDVGKTGRLSIRIQVDPVFVGGTTISYASGHNVSWMQAKDVRVGDTVVVKRANDVIPYVDKVLLEQRPEGAEAWVPPEKDPAGNDWDKSTLLWRSTTPELSVLGLLEYGVSRDCLDIEGIGSEIAAALVEQGLVTDISGLFTLTRDQLSTLELDSGRVVGEKTADKIMAEIQGAKEAAWNRVITALGIRATGRTMGRRLAAAFPNMSALRSATVDDLATVDGIGTKKAAVIREGLDKLDTNGVLDRLDTAGVNMGDNGGDTSGPRPLDGEAVVVTGSVPGLNRTQVQERIESLGGRASGSVSTSTTLLVADPAATSSKVTKAKKLGIRIISPEEFLNL